VRMLFRWRDSVRKVIGREDQIFRSSGDNQKSNPVLAKVW
jgi:hypothetical protein